MLHRAGIVKHGSYHEDYMDCFQDHSITSFSVTRKP